MMLILVVFPLKNDIFVRVLVLISGWSAKPLMLMLIRDFCYDFKADGEFVQISRPSHD